jgi:hypothetical protein
MLQPPATGPISNASAAYLGVDAHDFADGAQRVKLQAVRLSLLNSFCKCSEYHFAVLRSKGSVLQFALADAPQAWSSQADWSSLLSLWQLY